MSLVFDMMAQRFLGEEFRSAGYEWDSWRSTHYFMYQDAEVIQSLAGIADDAVISLTLGMLEWVCARHGRAPMTAEVLEYVDAVWTAHLTGVPVALCEFDSATWQGPILEPLRFAQLIASELPYEANQDGNFLARACWAYQLACHVVGKERASLVAWFEENARSLSITYPFASPGWRSIFDDTFAPAVKCPPTVLMHAGAFDLAVVDRGIRDQLRRTDGNDYLSTTAVSSEA